MYIEIQYPTRIYWRAFSANDTVLISGLADGWVEAGDMITTALNVSAYKMRIPAPIPLTP